METQLTSERKTPLYCTYHFWINILCFVVLSVIIAVTSSGLLPIQVGFYCGDPLLSFKEKKETVTTLMLTVINPLLSLFIVVLTETLRQRSFGKKTITICFYIFREGFIGFFLLGFIHAVAKSIMVEHRPQFFNICRPDTAENCTVGAYVESFTCRGNEKYSRFAVKDSSMSFPSGHAGFSWYTAVCLSYVVQERMPKYVASLVKTFLICVCVTYALLCSLTRIVDRQHHWWDVLAGAIIGILVALNTVRLIHLSLQNLNKPKSQMIEENEDV